MDGIGTHCFGGAAHAYHPDETAAVLLAECMVRDVEEARCGSVRRCRSGGMVWGYEQVVRRLRANTP